MKLRTFWMALLLIALSFSMTHDIVLSGDMPNHHTSVHTQDLDSSTDADLSCELHSMFHISFILPQTHQLALTTEHFIITSFKNQYPKNHSVIPTYRPPITA
jgi:hypothetical protein